MNTNISPWIPIIPDGSLMDLDKWSILIYCERSWCTKNDLSIVGMVRNVHHSYDKVLKFVSIKYANLKCQIIVEKCQWYLTDPVINDPGKYFSKDNKSHRMYIVLVLKIYSL